MLYAHYYSYRNRLCILTSPVAKYRLSQDLTKRSWGDTQFKYYMNILTYSIRIRNILVKFCFWLSSRALFTVWLSYRRFLSINSHVCEAISRLAEINWSKVFVLWSIGWWTATIVSFKCCKLNILRDYSIPIIHHHAIEEWPDKKITKSETCCLTYILSFE